MKNVKIVLSALVAVAGIVTMSSFISQDFKGNAFEQVCFQYIASDKSPNTAAPVRLEVNYQSSLTPASECPASEVLCGICFDTDDYTFEQARNAFGDYLQSLINANPGTTQVWDLVPSADPFTIPNTTIQVYKVEQE